MKLSVNLPRQVYQIDTQKPLDIAIPIRAGSEPKAWYAPDVKIEPVKDGSFVGSIQEGSSVNFYSLNITPHGNGTHTECVGHIVDGPYTIQDCLQEYLFLAQVCSIEPSKVGNNTFLSLDSFKKISFQKEIKALIIRTLPNADAKLTQNYSGQNACFVEPEVMLYLHELGIEHLLIDTPSVDPEQDGGKLLAHKAFWMPQGEILKHKTITEMIYVPDQIKDGIYLLQLGILSLHSDASPSKPVLYKVEM